MSTRIDPRLYDPARWDALVERVFRPAWYVVGLAPDPGRAVPTTLLPGVLDEPILLVTGPEGTTRAFSNVCTHRGAVVATRPLGIDEIRCPYHGRRYGRDGRCLAAPGFLATPDEPLPELPVRRLGPLVFTSVGSAPNWAPVQTSVENRRLGHFRWEEVHHDPAGDAVYEVDAHPLLYVENYLEGLHIPFVHPALNRALDWNAYENDLLPNGTLQVGVAAADVPTLDLPADHVDHGRGIAAYYLTLFPFTLLNYYPWGVSVNLIEPVNPRHTRVRYVRLVARPDLLEQGAGAGLGTVETEDDSVVERVQRGVRSRLFRGGVLEASWEVGVAAYQNWLLLQLDGVSGPDGLVARKP